MFASSYIQIGTDFVTDRDFAALDFLDHELLGDVKPERRYNETVDYGLEKLVLEFYKKKKKKLVLEETLNSFFYILLY